MKGEDREDEGMEQFQERELLCQAGTGIRPLERKEGAILALNVIPKECGIDPLGSRKTWKA